MTNKCVAVQCALKLYFVAMFKDFRNVIFVQLVTDVHQHYSHGFMYAECKKCQNKKHKTYLYIGFFLHKENLFF